MYEKQLDCAQTLPAIAMHLIEAHWPSAAIARLGVTPEHRRSFRPVREALNISR